MIHHMRIVPYHHPVVVVWKKKGGPVNRMALLASIAMHGQSCRFLLEHANGACDNMFIVTRLP
jgi:hypothetical protein